MNVFDKTHNFITGTYKRFPVAFERGEGMYLYDDRGSEYLDFLAGIAVNVLGHSHKIIKEAIAYQSQRLIHVSNLYYIKEQADLAEYLIGHSVLDKVFFCNSGAEANESAIKLARLYGEGKRYKIITMEDSFHGRTLASLSATGQKKYHKGFEPMPAGFEYAKLDDFNDLKDKADDKTVAVIVEFIQGEGGINVADRDYMKKVYDFCKSRDMLFIADEVQTGGGRTGRFFAYEYFGIEPDIVTLAKSLGGGLPIGAMLAKDAVAKYFTHGTHGSTFGGSPFVSYVSLQTVKYIVESGLMKHAEEVGAYFLNKLKDIAKKSKDVESASGMGLILGLHMKDEEKATNLVAKALDNKILIGKAGGSTVRFEPPLIVEKEHVDIVIDFLDNEL